MIFFKIVLTSLFCFINTPAIESQFTIAEIKQQEYLKNTIPNRFLGTILTTKEKKVTIEELKTYVLIANPIINDKSNIIVEKIDNINYYAIIKISGSSDKFLVCYNIAFIESSPSWFLSYITSINTEFYRPNLGKLNSDSHENIKKAIKRKYPEITADNTKIGYIQTIKRKQQTQNILYTKRAFIAINWSPSNALYMFYDFTTTQSNIDIKETEEQRYSNYDFKIRNRVLGTFATKPTKEKILSRLKELNSNVSNISDYIVEENQDTYAIVKANNNRDAVYYHYNTKVELQAKINTLNADRNLGILGTKKELTIEKIKTKIRTKYFNKPNMFNNAWEIVIHGIYQINSIANFANVVIYHKTDKTQFIKISFKFEIIVPTEPSSINQSSKP